MTVTTDGRVDRVDRLELGQIDSLVKSAGDDDLLIGRMLYVQSEHLLLVPLERNGEMYWCRILVRLDDDWARQHEHQNVSVFDLQAAWPAIETDYLDPDTYMVAWFARIGAAMWHDDQWPIVREVVRLARVPGTTHIAMYHAMTVKVIQAIRNMPREPQDTGIEPDALRHLIEDLVRSGFLRRSTGTPSSVKLSFGTFYAVAEGLPEWRRWA